MNTSFQLLIITVITLFVASCSEKEKEWDATGTFEATEVTVSAKASGELTTFYVEEGEECAADATVGSIDAVQLRLKKDQLNTANAELEANKRQLAHTKNANNQRRLDPETQTAALRQKIANAKREQQRFTELVADGAAPRKQLDDIKYEISVLEKELEATVSRLNSENASLGDQGEGFEAQIDGIGAKQDNITVQQAQLDDQIMSTLIKCPITGTVLEKYVQRGEFVSIGKPLFKIADTKNMTLRAYVTSAQLESLKVGQTVTVTTDFGNNRGRSFSGTVTWISPRSEFTPKTILTDDERADLVYAVKVAVKNDGSIKMGMYGKLKLSNAKGSR